MRIREFMTRDVRTITPDRPLTEAAEIMRIRGIRHLPVVERGKLAGVLSNRDLASITRAELQQVRVSDVMHRDVVTIEPEATMAQAANRMKAHHVGSLPVMDGDHLVGIITITDMLEQLARTSRRSTRGTTTRRDAGRRPHA